MVECEFIIYAELHGRISVLIDTWWNVNVRVCDIASELLVVLIDTWWNVNNMLGSAATNELTVLIDTWWNVN